MKKNSKFVHGGQDNIDPAYASVMPPIYQSSTFQQTNPRNHKGYAYSRSSNPTRTALQKAIASIENTKFGFVFGSGMAAIDTVMKLLQSGDEVICSMDLYGGSYRLFNNFSQSFGVKFRYIDVNDIEGIKKNINQNTKMIWVETPTNPLLKIIDIKALAKITKDRKLLLCIDNTFATPYLQNPIDLGADIVMHSATKYLGGHSDVVLGLLAVKNSQIAEQLSFIQKAYGAIAGPMDCFLVLRGIKTLHVRMERHCKNTREIATYLHDHKQVEKVYWPGLPSHANHHIAKHQMKDFGGMLAFKLKDYSLEQTLKVVKKLSLFTLAESLGGVESLVGHPTSMTHASIPKPLREQMGVVDSLLRLSVGIEDVEDLLLDLESALSI